MAPSSVDRTRVFISYSHRDRRYLEELLAHLRFYEQKGNIDFWDDTKISSGIEWYSEIKRALDSAKIAVLLISADFLASDFVREYELPALLAAAKQDELPILSVILGPCAFQYTPLARYQVINNYSAPLMGMRKMKRDEVWTQLVQRIQNMLPPVNAPDEATLAPITTLSTYQGHAERVNAVAWSPDGSRIASGSDDKTVQIWDAVTGRHIVTFKGHNSFVFTLAWSPDAKLLASAGEDQRVLIWDANTKRRSISLDYSKAIAALAWAPDGRHIALGSINIWPKMSENDVVQVVDVSTRDAIFTHQSHFRTVSSLSWSPDGKYIASANFDGVVEILDVTARTSLYTYKGSSEQVNTIAWSPVPSKPFIASGGDDSTIQIWDAASRNVVCTYQGHSGPVLTIAWSPDGKYIASAGEGQVVQIWNVATKECIWTYYGHSSSVLAVSWSPDGQRIASAGQDKTVHVWQIGRSSSNS